MVVEVLKFISLWTLLALSWKTVIEMGFKCRLPQGNVVLWSFATTAFIYLQWLLEI